MSPLTCQALSSLSRWSKVIPNEQLSLDLHTCQMSLKVPVTPFPFLEIPPWCRAELLAPTTPECNKSVFPVVESGDEMKGHQVPNNLSSADPLEFWLPSENFSSLSFTMLVCVF